MNDNEWKIFEINLIDKYIKDPNAELAEALIKEYSAHKINNTEITKELQTWIGKSSTQLLENKRNIPEIFGFSGKWSRSKSEIKNISMNVHTWNHIFNSPPLAAAYEATAKIFDTNIDDVKIAFERKNHDFGTRELCRLGLDIFIAMDTRQLTSYEMNIANKHLKEDVSIQMLKDLNHHRMKYRITY